MIQFALRFTFAVSLLAACGNDGAGPIEPGPDAAIEPISRSPIEACIANGGALAQKWATGNQHGAVTSLTVTGTTVVLGSEDGSVKQWAVSATPSYGTSFDNGESGRPVTRALAVASDDTVLGADASGALGEWRLSDAKPMRTTAVTTVPLVALAVDAGANHVAVGGGTDIRVVDRAANTTSPKLTTTLWDVDALAFGATALFTAGHFYSTPQIERRDAAAPTEVVDRWNDQAKTGHVRAIAVSRDGAHLLAGGDGFIAILDAANLAAGPIAFVPAEGHNVIGLVALSGNELFATAGSEGSVQLWKVTGEHVATLAVAAPVGLGVDKPGAQLFTSGADGQLRALTCK